MSLLLGPRNDICVVYYIETKENERLIRMVINSDAPTNLSDPKRTKLCKIRPVKNSSGHIYYVEKELLTKIYHVVRLQPKYNKIYRKWDVVKTRVYST